MLLFRSNPWFIPLLFPGNIWHFSRSEKVIYLTFDDGPIPEITEWVLETLAQYKAEATFFCIGNNIEKHPKIFKQIVAAGHRIGNHTFNHLKGWQTDTETYIANTQQCHNIIQSIAPQVLNQPLLFRPPYLRISKAQHQILKKQYKMVYFDYITEDYEAKLSPEACKQAAIKHIKPGSVVIMHDSIKAAPRLMATLPAILEHYTSKGFTFKALP